LFVKYIITDLNHYEDIYNWFNININIKMDAQQKLRSDDFF